MRAGEIGNKFYLILKGSTSVLIPKKKTSVVVTPDASIDESTFNQEANLLVKRIERILNDQEVSYDKLPKEFKKQQFAEFTEFLNEMNKKD